LNAILEVDDKIGTIENNHLPRKCVLLAPGDTQQQLDELRYQLPGLHSEASRLKGNLETWRNFVSEEIPADKFFKWLGRKFAPREPKDPGTLNEIFIEANTTYQYLNGIKEFVSRIIPHDQFYNWLNNQYEAEKE